MTFQALASDWSIAPEIGYDLQSCSQGLGLWNIAIAYFECVLKLCYIAYVVAYLLFPLYSLKFSDLSFALINITSQFCYILASYMIK